MDRQNWMELARKVVRDQPSLVFATVGRKETKLWELTPVVMSNIDLNASQQWRIHELETVWLI